MQTSRGKIRYEETQYGFNYGAAEITRIHSDDKQGWVILSLKSPKAELQIYVTKTGKIRVWNYKTGQEYQAPKQEVDTNDLP